MKRATAVLAMVLGVSLATGLAVLPATAAMPQSLTINVLRDADDTWSSSGAFSDSGAFTEVPGVRNFFAGSSSTFHVVRTFTGDDGTFTTRADVRIGATSDPNVLSVTGRWAVLSGTGAYAKLTGAGSISETVDFSTGVIQGTWQGRVLL